MAREWFIKATGEPSVVVGTEELLLPYDPAGLMLSPSTVDEHKQVRLALLGEIMDGSALAVSTVWMKLQDWFNSLAQSRPASTLGQKCGMDREDNIAVDLKGNVYTCQNTGDAAHKIGHVDDVNEVRLTKATHWSLREECRRCPVVQLCKGACMYLEGEYWRRACDNSFTYNVAMLTGALWMITGKIATAIDGPMRRDGA
ncbi:MAG: SPASM domain-containing protein [Boseongicola sp.]|nr:SPASM domain-containing protein [Boseongicola sp.]